MENIINWLTFTKDNPSSLSTWAYRYQCHIPLWVKDDTLIVLDWLFYYPEHHTPEFKWATFSLFDKCNEETIDQRKAEAPENYRDIWVEAVKNAHTNLSLSDWCEWLESEYFYDSSYRWEDWYETLVEKMKTVEGWDDTEFFNCSGGWRAYEEWMETADYWDISFIDGIDPNIIKTMKEFETVNNTTTNQDTTNDSTDTHQ